MPGGLFSRIKVWGATEVIINSDLNAEFDNIIANLVPAYFDDYSLTVAQMKMQTDPGELGSESQATSLAGELERIRFMIHELSGKAYWYQSPASSIADIISAVGSGFPSDRIASGKMRTTSSQPLFLHADGSVRTITLKGASVNFVYYISSTQYSITTDLSITSLTAAPTSNNTALVNDATLTAQASSKLVGENGSDMVIDTVGSEITSLIGKLAGFKITHAGNTEYFVGLVGTNKISKIMRGYFFDSSDAPIPRISIADNDPITLMKLTWLFAKTDGSLGISYNNPRVSGTAPVSPAVGDYWFDMSTNVWKIYTGTQFIDSTAILIGVCIQDGTATVGARGFDFYKPHDERSTVELFYEGVAELRSRRIGSNIVVYGTTLRYDYDFLRWVMTTDLDSGVPEAASTYYYFYVTETGSFVISNVAPFDRRADLLGHYHPHQTWRCVGQAFNDGSQNLGAVDSFFRNYDSRPLEPIHTATTNLQVISKFVPVSTTGGAFTDYLPPLAAARGMTFVFQKTTDDLTLFTLSSINSETIIEGATSATTTTLATFGETIEIFGGDASYYVMRRYAPMTWRAYTPTFQGAGTAAAIDFRYRRMGPTLEVQGVFTTGTVSAAQAQISFPTSIVSAIATATPGALVGFCTANDAGNLKSVTSIAWNAFFTLGVVGTSMGPATGTAAWNSTVKYSVDARFPVTGWL